MLRDGGVPLFHDGTERPIPRPQDPREQKDYWSGKAHDHTVKNVLLADRAARIWFLSDTYKGSAYEKLMADVTPYPLPVGSELLQDLGYLGFTLPDVTITMPHKNANGQPVTNEQKTTNRQIGRRRVFVEHIISAIKRCAILKDDLRIRTDRIRDTVMEIACGFQNFRIRHIPWQPAT